MYYPPLPQGGGRSSFSYVKDIIKVYLSIDLEDNEVWLVCLSTQTGLQANSLTIK